MPFPIVSTDGAGIDGFWCQCCRCKRVFQSMTRDALCEPCDEDLAIERHDEDTADPWEESEPCP